jgi:hypothetical protein
MNTRPERPMLRLGSPTAMLAVIPALLGFHPEHSLVVIGVRQPRGRVEVVFRYDLPQPPNPVTASKIAGHATSVLTRNQLTRAVIAGYGPGPMVTPVTDALVAALRRAGVTLHDVLRIEDGRYWSYACHDPHCCPPEGVPFDPRYHPASAALAAVGSPVLADRAALAATIAPLRALTAESISQAERTVRAKGAAAGLVAVGEAISTYRADGQLSGDDQFALLAVTLADLRVRDDGWARMDPDHVQAHLRLWTDVVRRAPARYVPPPASLLAFVAWQSGNGALANVAAERALAADPGYSMAQLLLDAVGAGVPPSAARLPMTPEEVAASYAEHDTHR